MKNLIVIIVALIAASNVFAQENSFLKKVPDDIKNTKVFNRFAWDYNQRAFPYDTIPSTRYAQEMNREIEKAKSNSKKNASTSLWTSIGPFGLQPHSFNEDWGITSGRVRSVAVHPENPSVVYIGAASGGIWKTEDGGETWLDIGSELESLNFGAIAIDPSNPDIVYAGSGEAIFLTGTINFYGRGIFKSTNGGETWIQITNGFGDFTFFSDLSVSPHNSDMLLATMASGSAYLGSVMPNEGIWKSSDAGATWVRVLDVLDAYDVLFHPGSPDIVYAAIGGMNNDAGFYISNDQGETWTQHNSGLQDENTIARMQIDLSLTNTNILYAVIYEPGGSNFLGGKTRAYKSIDAGINWAQISTGLSLGGNYGNGWVDQGFYDLCIAVDPIDPDHVFIGNIELHETTNGEVFSPVRPNGINAWGSLVHVDYHQLVFAPSNPDYLYIGCDGGIYKTTDGGLSAVSLNEGLATLQFYRIASHPTNSNVVIGGMQDNGTAMTFDVGGSWEAVVIGDGMECLFSYSNPDIVYAATQNGYLRKSINGGSYFVYVGNFAGAWITPIIMHPTESETLYVASKNIFRTTNGTNFSIIANNIAPVSVSALAQSPVNPDNMILATGGGDSPAPDTIFLVKISKDGGYTWSDVTENILGETRWISRVETDPIDELTMYVLRTGFSPGNKLYKTTNLGNTWINISGDLPDLPCHDIFIDPDSTGHLYLANDIGVYQSKDGGVSWNYASEGIPFVPVFDFDFAKIDGVRYLRAGTHGRSVFESKIDVQVGIVENEISKEQNEFAAIKIFPNPVFGSATIGYKLKQASTIQLTIYDYLGNEIEEIKKRHGRGKQQIIWDAEGLPAGIYFCVLKTESGIQTMKMIKLK